MPDYVAFHKGETYRVKDKFPDNNNEVTTGIWKISNGSSLFDIGYDVRKEYFEI